MKVLVDTNVLLDVLTQRRPFFEDSAKVWSLVQTGLIDGFLAAISVNNLYYIIRKLRNKRTAENFVDDLLRDFEIVSLTKSIFKQARTIPDKDYEDAIQYFSAIQEACDILITRNKKDFPSTGLQLLTPAEFLDKLRKFEN